MDYCKGVKLPSQTTDDAWLVAYCVAKNYSYIAKGKWLVHALKERIDDLWKLIALATEEGYLGTFSKVSTVGLKSTAKTEVHVICIYTYDIHDYNDIMRIRDFLRDLGIISPISYQTWNEKEIVTLYKI